MQLVLEDAAYVDRLVAFLRSLGRQPRVAGPQQIEVDGEREEVEVYLRVWRVIHPDADAEVFLLPAASDDDGAAEEILH